MTSDQHQQEYYYNCASPRLYSLIDSLFLSMHVYYTGSISSAITYILVGCYLVIRLEVLLGIGIMSMIKNNFKKIKQGRSFTITLPFPVVPTQSLRHGSAPVCPGS